MNFISRYLPVVVAVLFLAVYLRASLHADQAEPGETFEESRGTPPALMLQDLQGHAPSPTIVHFTMKQPVPGLILRGGPRIAADQWNAEGIPASFLLDRDGTIRASRVGGMDWSAPQTTQWVERLLAQGAGAAAVR